MNFPTQTPASEIFTQLHLMKPGDKGWISSIEAPAEIAQRLMEIGIVEGSYLEVMHEAPWSRDPLAIRVRGGLIALRRREAQHIGIQKVKSL